MYAMSTLGRWWMRTCDLIVNGPRLPRYETASEALAVDWQAVGADLRAATRAALSRAPRARYRHSGRQ